MISIRTLSACFAAVALSIATVAASAEKWPERPIKVISPFTAGNAGDTVARIVFDQVSQQIGQTLFIENRPGAGGTLAADFVARSDPDGYTLLLSSASLSSQVIFHRTLPYDAIRAFAPVKACPIPAGSLSPPRSGRRVRKSISKFIGPSSLSVPTLAVVNTADDVAPLNALKPFADAMAKNIRIIEYPGELGVCLQHLGILVGRHAQAQVWPEILSWLKSQD